MTILFFPLAGPELLMERKLGAQEKTLREQPRDTIVDESTRRRDLHEHLFPNQINSSPLKGNWPERSTGSICT